MQLFFAVLLFHVVQGVTTGPSRHSALLNVHMWSNDTDHATHGLTDPESALPVQAIVNTRQKHTADSTQYAFAKWSEKKKERKDPYEPESPGPATVSDWCNQPTVHDPACLANPVVISLEEEINLVMMHFRCKRNPASCGALEESDKSPKGGKNNKYDGKSTWKRHVTKGADGDTGDKKHRKTAESRQTQTEPKESDKDIGAKDRKASKSKEGEKGAAGEDAGAKEAHGHRKEAEPIQETDGKDDTRSAAKEDGKGGIGRFGMKEFNKTAKEKYGNSDKSWDAADKDGNGALSEAEFQNQCQGLGGSQDDCGDLPEEMGARKGGAVSEENYKDALGPTPGEIARRMRGKYPSPEDAFDAGDVDNDGQMSDWELYEQCSLVSTLEACKELQQQLGKNGTVSKEAYKEWMKTGRTPQDGAEDDLKEVEVLEVNPEESVTKIEVLVDELKEEKKDIEEQGELDPELRNSMEQMIRTGDKALETLEEVAPMGDKEIEKEMTRMVDAAENLDDAIFGFETGVHPHGYKWWRYRWEYAFVEANILNLLVFLTMLLYLLLHWLTDKALKWSHTVDVEEGSSVVNLYYRVFNRCMHELNVLGAIAFLIWALEECGVFKWIVQYLPGQGNPVNTFIHAVHALDSLQSNTTGAGNQLRSSSLHDQHWPTTDHHVIYTLRTVNMHLFLGILLYYLIMYHITLGAVCIIKQFMRHENREFYNNFLEVGSKSEYFGSFKEQTSDFNARADATHKMFLNETWLEKLLARDATFARIFGHFDVDEDYSNLKKYVANHVQFHEGFEDLYKVILAKPFYPYLVRRLYSTLMSMIVIDWRVWLLVQVVLVVQAATHYFFHLAVVELLPITVLIGSCILAFQFIWTRIRIDYVVNEANQAASEDEGKTTEELEEREHEETRLLWLQQLNFFFLCFSAARLLFSSFFWTDYFRLSCCMLLLFLSLYLVIAFVGALTIPMFFIMKAVPPNVSKSDRELMKHVMETFDEDENESKMENRWDGSKMRAKRDGSKMRIFLP